MVETLTDMIHREWNLINSETNENSNNNPSWHSRLFSRKTSDNNNNQRQQSNSDYNDIASLAAVRNPKPLSDRKNLDAIDDNDETPKNISKHHHHHHHHSSSNYEHLVSPRLSVRRLGMHSPKQGRFVPLQNQLPHKARLTASVSLGNSQNHVDKDEDSNHDEAAHPGRNRLSRRGHQQSAPNGNHGARALRSTPIPQHGGPLVATPVLQPLRIIFMRHSERANQALGPDWFFKAFRTKTYRPYDENLPKILPKRRFDQAYEFDAPLTVRGLKIARLTGRAMMNSNLLVDICLTSTALRCVQTCERILTGMERRDQIPIRIEPGLFECPHLNHRIVESFMTKTELMENRYNIKQDYKPFISKVTVPETLDGYFERSSAVMRGIMERYGHHGGTVLIVTHAPGLLVLTDALKGIKPNVETFYRTVSTYPPLAMLVAEYDRSKWKFSEHPFNIVSTGI